MAQVSYIVQLIRLGCEYRDVSYDMIDLPSSVPNQKDQYVYVRSPPDENPYLSVGVDQHRPLSKIELSDEGTTASLLSVSAQQSLLGSVVNKVTRSLRRSRSKSPQPEGVVRPRPTSPYLFSQSSNRGNNIEVSLDTLPSKSPLKKEEEKDREIEHSPARKVWGLFQWRRKKKQRSIHSRSSLPPFRQQENHKPQTQDKSNTLDFGASLNDGGVYEDTDSEHHSVTSANRRSMIDASDSFAIGGGPGAPNNLVTVEVEVHDVDVSLEMNAESPVHKRNSYRSSSANSTLNNGPYPEPGGGRGEFLSLPEATQKSHQSRRKILTIGTPRDAKQKNKPKNRGNDLNTPLLLDHDTDEFDVSDDSYDAESAGGVSSLRTSSFIVVESESSLREPVVDYFSEEAVAKLERNFKKDHLFSGEATDMMEAVTSTVKQGQVYI